jgi:hypothetical protein
VKLIILGMGLYLLFGPHMLDKMSETAQRVFGGVLAGYGIIRTWMTIRQMQQRNKPQGDDE